MTLMHTCFTVEITGKVAHVQMSRPDELNTMTAAFWEEWPAIVRSLSARGDVRVIVLSSTGRHFSAGMDLSVFTSGALSPAGEPGRVNMNRVLQVRHLQDSISSPERARVAVLAAIQGGCIGGAVDMVTACDLRYASSDAYFVVHETNIGMTADVGTLQRLPGIVGDGVAREMVLTGRPMSADRACEVGLVNAVFADHDALIAGVLEIAHEIAGKSPLVTWGNKESLIYARDHGVADSLQQIATWQSGALQPGDLTESLAAQAQKRPPVYADLDPEPGALPGA
ncbi:MAG: crotonase/enoyl-CoA hydratase family protein [Actinobacteria bacterium]|uniref:Unannotated protein n=1 Tax=freshwater metagenome TaxID=449393 RepID=A0A6J7F145_9ZZZZ|nr:crotonase/enoyl-CoA hydratase family protein [Actinomycetota bacterium]